MKSRSKLLLIFVVVAAVAFGFSKSIVELPWPLSDLLRLVGVVGVTIALFWAAVSFTNMLQAVIALGVAQGVEKGITALLSNSDIVQKEIARAIADERDSE
jgi:hypothetical protein